jgi:prepilin-type N-terminal cleavage/methylation domain-containing protein
MLKNKKGFTLIELLIVVAIIAILAAIAIPQFSSYRIKGYNSAATADLRNARTAEEAFFSDWQVYSSTKADGTAGPGIVYDNTTGALAVKKGTIGSAPSADTTFLSGVSQNVILIINTSPAPDDGQASTLYTKNTAGDRCYGMDSDLTSLYWVNGVGALTAGSTVASTKGTNDLCPGAAPCTPTNGTGNCAGLTGGTGQKTWVAL